MQNAVENESDVKLYLLNIYFALVGPSCSVHLAMLGMTTILVNLVSHQKSSTTPNRQTLYNCDVNEPVLHFFLERSTGLLFHFDINELKKKHLRK